MADIPRLTSGNIPTNLVVGSSGAVTSDIFIGNFGEVMIGVRQSFRFKVLHEAFIADGKIGFLADLRGRLVQVFDLRACK